MLLVVAEDHHAEGALRRTLAAALAAGEEATILTSDARLAMRLRREFPRDRNVDVLLPIDCFRGDPKLAQSGAANAKVKSADAAALDGVAAAVGSYATLGGTDFAPYFQYTLIPSFIRAVRDVVATQDLVASPPKRAVLIGGGALVDAAALVLARRAVPAERVEADLLTRANHALARLRAGRATRWVNTEFRALILEPGFLALLNLKGLWRRLTEAAPAAALRDALIVVGDRFTSDVVERMRGGARPIILAGATQPGRALFDRVGSLVPLESFARWTDVLQTFATAIEAAGRSIALATDSAHGASKPFMLDDVSYWPLVRRAAALHVLIWTQKLRHVQTLTTRAVGAAPGGRLLTSTDVTAYNRLVVDTARKLGMRTMGIQHGITGEPNGHTIVHVDTLATWGEEAETWYRAEAAERGIQQTARFEVTGNPRFDSLAERIGAVGAPRTPHPAPSTPHLAPRTSHLAPGPSQLAPGSPFTICLCTAFFSDFSVSASEYENLAMIDAVLAWARDKPDVRVIHKMHPGEEVEYYAAAARSLGWDPLKLTTISEPILHDILQQSDVQVSVYSSTVLEAVALGTPSIVFDAIVQRNLVDNAPDRLRDVPGVRIAYEPGDLAAFLDEMKAQGPPDREALASSAQLRRFLGTLDGRATERVAALVDRV